MINWATHFTVTISALPRTHLLGLSNRQFFLILTIFLIWYRIFIWVKNFWIASFWTTLIRASILPLKFWLSVFANFDLRNDYLTLFFGLFVHLKRGWSIFLYIFFFGLFSRSFFIDLTHATYPRLRRFEHSLNALLFFPIWIIQMYWRILLLYIQ